MAEKIHARGVTKKQYQKCVEAVAKSKKQGNPITWADLVASGQCGPTRAERAGTKGGVDKVLAAARRHQKRSAAA